MPADVDSVESPPIARPSSRPSPSSSPPQHSPAPVDNDAPPRPHPASLSNILNGKPALPSVATVDELPPKEKKSRPAPSIKPASSAAGAKPKSTKSGARSPSPTPPSRVPLQTVRLEITLGGPDAYEVDIAALSKATGQRQPTPVPPPKRDTSDDSQSEGDDEGDGKKKRKKRKYAAGEYYDTADPFIDDSELAQDERTFFAQTKQKGFYVSSGQVALLNKTPKKPKSKKVNILAPSASITAALSSAPLPPSLSQSALPRPPQSAAAKVKVEGTRDSPIALLSDGEDDRGTKRKHVVDSNGAGPSGPNGVQEGSSKKRRKTVEIQPFHPELEVMLEQLRNAIPKENWDVKGKFPPALKPLLAQVALKAVMLGEYDDNFFNLMPRLFPYNKFTMTKLIKRTIWREHTDLLMERQHALLQELKVLADEGFPKAQEEWERSVLAWERRQERAKAEVDAGGSTTHSVEGTPDLPTAPQLAQRPSLDEGGNDTGVEDGANASNAKARDMHPPGKKYRLTDTMKAVIWQLVCLSNECCRIENEKNSLEGSNQVVSDQGVRKTLYQKIVSAFPEGWLSSGQISREVSVMKKKYEKEVLENEG
ncbi:hypothetical protein WOLCODRAFT_129469 [Wolfiporia cocos MD-104 SS10]|uniref:Ubinuclein middle domain-containing protein n=1 Tax=Wolfiporia cocos (strain MD-104) TaxID=742152 RepID=A0A2H3JBR0_WOLCO|nr:hypothetical protein WOLCODRAFT_129469 [Wolfiporia cocos MD-104 SS10]